MKEWIDMTDEEKKKEDIETYFVEFLLDCKRECVVYDMNNWGIYERKFDELKNFIERKK